MPEFDASLLHALAQAWACVLERDHDSWAIKDGATGAWLAVDARLAGWLARDASQVTGRTDAELFDAATATAQRAADQTAMGLEGPLTTEHRFELGGQRREFSVLRQRATAADGRSLLVTVWRDLAPARKREAQLKAALEQLEREQVANALLRKQAAQGATPRDSATGLYNPAHFEDQLRREVDLSTREHREFALVSIEIDPPAPEVAALGPTAQARVHESLGRLLSGNTRAMDAACHVGGARFAVLLSGVGLATAHSRMEGLRRQCATQIVAYEGREIGFTVSMGVASFPHTAHGQDELRAACDAALADSRERGGNRVTLASIRFEAR
jgi:diguanylate cyclase (GGDEF)-like protein